MKTLMKSLVISFITAASVWIPTTTMAGESGATPINQTATSAVMATGLHHPWSMAWLPDGRTLITEKSGQLRIYENGVLTKDPVQGVPEVLFAAQGGLFEVLPHPEFATNQTLFLSYASGTMDANGTRVMRARLDGHQLVDQQVIFDVQPTKDTPVHYGGRMVLLADGTLLVTTGDGFSYREAAQDGSGLLGKVVRIHQDGSTPADNPFGGSTDHRQEIYSMGHRNPQGLAVDANGTIWLNEHGARGGDEINKISPGLNYGWPAITHGIDYSGSYVSPYQNWPGLEQPIHFWTPSIAPAGMAVYYGYERPDWHGDLFVTGLVTHALHHLRVEDGTVVAEERLLVDLDSRLRDVRMGPDGHLWVLTDGPDGSLLRISLAAGQHRVQPTANGVAEPAAR